MSTQRRKQTGILQRFCDVETDTSLSEAEGGQERGRVHLDFQENELHEACAIFGNP